MKNVSAKRYFPAIVRDTYVSPVDALIGLCVPQDEAMDLVAASWRQGDASEPLSVVTTVDGGRAVAAVYEADGRWAACNAFLEHASSSRTDAERRLKKLLKRGRRGCIGVLAGVSAERPV
ncbi:hypothetical protein [Propionivibrio limicola]|uniref:hypothetical protein n=1 Tax=Propionivibrio limicola TaxID=167645 RepID=UPI0012913E08|nr:hypothetical protein [Propionivibrio limicola]